MVTWDPASRHLVISTNGVHKYFGHGSCLSTDSKPTADIANGSTLLEMNTSNVYTFDEANTTWRLLS